MEINFIGQCGFIFKTNELSIAIDPMLDELIEHGVNWRIYPPVFAPEELAVDYIICTHEHVDHMAMDTVRGALKSHPNTKIIVPKGCVKLLLEAEILAENIVGINDGETVDLEFGVKVSGISTAHPIHQVDANGDDCNLACCIEFDGKKIVHLGDTYYTERLKDSLKNLGDIDLFFTPINGMDEDKAKRGLIGNMSCEESAKLAVELGAKLTIPTHFDMIVGNTENPDNFIKELQKIDRNSKYIIPVIGKKIIVE